MFLHGPDLLTSRIGVEERVREKLTIEIHGNILACGCAILCTLHIVLKTERDITHEVSIHGDLLRESRVVKRLYTMHLSYIMPISDAALATKCLNMIIHDMFKTFSHLE